METKLPISCLLPEVRTTWNQGKGAKIRVALIYLGFYRYNAHVRRREGG